jgi:hypothetical protein
LGPQGDGTHGFIIAGGGAGSLGGAITENSVLLFKEYKKINMDIPNGN